MGMHALDSRDPDRFPLQLISDVLGGGMSSRLFQKIREQRGLAYAVQTFPSLHQDTGEFCVYVGTNPDNTELVIGLIKAEFADIAENGVTDEELDRAKESASGHLVLSTEATRTRMVRLGRAEVTDSEVLSAEDVIERLNAVTMDDVKRVAGRILTAPTTVAIVGPFDGYARRGVRCARAAGGGSMIRVLLPARLAGWAERPPRLSRLPTAWRSLLPSTPAPPVPRSLSGRTRRSCAPPTWRRPSMRAHRTS